jgi:hypothetical protein
MKDFIAFYKEKQIVVQANSSYEAQETAAKLFKAKKSYEVSVFLADKAVNTASI